MRDSRNLLIKQHRTYHFDGGPLNRCRVPLPPLDRRRHDQVRHEEREGERGEEVSPDRAEINN